MLPRFSPAGRAGRNILDVQDRAGVRVKVSDRDDLMPGTQSCRKVTIQGSFESVMHAQQVGRGGWQLRKEVIGAGQLFE